MVNPHSPGNDAFFAGIDIGSTMTKVAILDKDGKLRARIIGPTGAEHRRLANLVMQDALNQAGIPFDRISYIIATGYGRINVPFADRQVTELTCHARGVLNFFPDAHTVLDIGGQDAKGLKIQNGQLLDFVMNDRCAAGTGRFLEVLAGTLGVKLEDLGTISARSTPKLKISNTCTVFVRMEVATRLSEGVVLADIVAGVHDAIARRAVNMLKRLKIEPDVVFTGGVARNSGVVQAVAENLGYPVRVPEEPLLTGAIGAALIGKEAVMKARARGETINTKERRLSTASFFSD